MFVSLLRAIHILILLFVAITCKAQVNSFSTKAQKLLGVFNLYHVSPPPNNSEVSAEIVDLFIPELDNSGLILKQGDVLQLRKNNTELFNQINAGNSAYAQNASQVFLKALTSLDSLLVIMGGKALNFQESDTLYFLPPSAKRVYSANMKVHAKRVEKIVKYMAFEKVSNTEAFASMNEKEFNAKAQDLSKTVISSFRKMIRKRTAEADAIVETTLLNAICQRYDPHSNYFNEEQNKEFTTQLSASSESFGFLLMDNDEDQAIIASIEPGGSAWMSNEVNEGDLFISAKIGRLVISNEDQTAVDIQSTLNNSAEKSMTITIKKPNGILKTLKLVKQKTEVEDNNVQGYILKSEKLNIGYISLPSFYTNMGETLPGCANDVAKEILKLEKDTIAGLILDLRNNGGGSMQEAINLAGIFIDEGPLFIYKEKNKKPSLVKDSNRGSIFKKPLAVMINETSASASELFANVIKDYHAGLIVGQRSFGKATAQVILPLDTQLATKNNAQITDFLKITTGKFYRLNNSTHQGEGVIPDVEMPSLAGYSNFKENKEKYYLHPDSIVKKVMYFPAHEINADKIRTRSIDRRKTSNDFHRLENVSDSLSQAINLEQKVELKYTGYKKYKMDLDSLYEIFENSMTRKNSNVVCLNNTFDKKLTEVSSEMQEFNLKIRTDAEKDVFITELFEILKDFINQEKK